MIPVSVVTVTKNEGKNIGAALESVKDFDDIVVVDSFSEDNTLEICKRYTSRIFQHEWQGYARQKQMAIDYAKNKWVLLLDADERVTPELKEEIAQQINRDYCGFYIPRKNFFLGRWIRYSGWWPDYTLRLFRKDISYLEPREVHERVIVKGKTGYLKNPFEHYTYKTVSDFVAKMQNYSTLSAKEIIKAQNSSKVLLLKMVINPFFTFLKMFFLKQGFRDGIYGFILSGLYSFYTFLKYLKAWELKR